MSSTQGKTWIHDRVATLAADAPLSVLDIGPGVGTYARLFADLPLARITGLEVWEPYVARYGLRELYDEIRIGDVRTAALPDADVVVLGDVIEHMSAVDGLAVWRRCVEVARRAVYLSIPVVHYPQHDLEGNPFEVHVDEDWSHERVLATFPGIGSFELGDVVGVYECRTDAPDRPRDAGHQVTRTTS